MVLPTLPEMADGVRSAVALVVVALVWLVPGCSGPAPGADAGGPGPSVAMRTEPLDLAELRGRPALGFDLRAQPVLDPAQLDPADLRGPCGGSFALPLGSGSRQVFRSTAVLVVDARATAADAGAVVDRVAAGIRPGPCPGSVAVTVQSAALPAVGERRVGWVERRLGDGVTRLTFVALVAGGDRLGLLVVAAPDTLDHDEFAELVELAFRLR